MDLNFLIIILWPKTIWGMLLGTLMSFRTNSFFIEIAILAAGQNDPPPLAHMPW